MVRKYSRTRRFTRLRFTALPIVFTPTANPSLGRPSLFGMASTLNKESEDRVPLRWTASNWVFLVRRPRRGSPLAGDPGAGPACRAFRPTDACGLWLAGCARWHARSSSPCAHGSHGSSCDGGCSVEMCASCSAPYLPEKIDRIQQDVAAGKRARKDTQLLRQRQPRRTGRSRHIFDTHEPAAGIHFRVLSPLDK